MNKNLFKKLRGSDGNALLIAIFIMAILLAFGLGVNRLIIKEFQVERALVAGGQGYYSAEGAAELGMYDIQANLAGYEFEDQAGESFSGADYLYSVLAVGESWPCDMYGGQVSEDENGDLWRKIVAEESVMVPLFAGEDSISDFEIQYYDEDIASTDVLRWKILGINQTSGLTEAISNYEEDSVGVQTSFIASSENAYYYDSDSSPWGGRIYWMTMESVSNFLKTHDYNYLVLTNVADDSSYDDLFVRLSGAKDVSGNNMEMVCEYAKVEADGLVSDYIQQIDAYIKQGEPLPVFDFVLWEKDLVD
ncbi:MAG: hypothetical protein WCT46_02730 [Candidatus Gracilibacteria bacterium]